MLHLEWSDDFAIGVAPVDEEHRALIDTINRLGGQLEVRRSPVEVSETLGEISTMIAAHFALEEHLMRDLKFGDYAAHKADHDRLLGEIRDIARWAEETGLTDRRPELARRVRDWFARHFESFDTKLRVLAKRQPPD